MARLCTCYNSPTAGKDEVTKDALEVPIKSNSTFTCSPTISCVLIPALAQVPIPGPPDLYTDVDLQKTTKLALELFVKGQKHG